MQPIATIPVANVLGEGVLWDGRTQSVWWTDIEQCRLYRYVWPGGPLKTYVTPERLGSFGFVSGSSRLVAAFETGFALFDPETGALDWLWRKVRPGQRLNDGRVDCQGRFWAGSLAERREEKGKAELYCLDGKGQVTTHARGLTISNGICWSPDSSRFYLADSPAKLIWRYGFDPAAGTISDRQVFAADAGGIPDGSAVDAGGCLWNASWDTGCVIRYAPDGRLDRRIALPAGRPTCVAFGGPELNLLFVTSARFELDPEALQRQPEAGHLFVFLLDVAGLPEHRYRLSR